MYIRLSKELQMHEIDYYSKARIYLDHLENDNAGGIYDNIATGHVIVINDAYVDRFKKDPVETAYMLADILAHEMVHQICNIKGIADMDKNKKYYHVHAFIEQAAKCGLYINTQANVKYGYNDTVLPIDTYKELLHYEPIADILKKICIDKTIFRILIKH